MVFVVTLFVVNVGGDLRYLGVWWCGLHILLPNSQIHSMRFLLCVLPFQHADILHNSYMPIYCTTATCWYTAQQLHADILHNSYMPIYCTTATCWYTAQQLRADILHNSHMLIYCTTATWIFRHSLEFGVTNFIFFYI